jgi:hypothetical protein
MANHNARASQRETPNTPRPANEAKVSNIDQDRMIRFVHDVLCAAQKDSPGNGEKALERRGE